MFKYAIIFIAGFAISFLFKSIQEFPRVISALLPDRWDEMAPWPGAGRWRTDIWPFPLGYTLKWET